MPPSPGLAPFVLKYYQIQGMTSPLHPHNGWLLPRPVVMMNFHFEQKIRINSTNYDGQNIPAINVAGGVTKPAQVCHDRGAADVFGVVFRPGCFRHFTRLPQQELTDNLVELREIFGPGADDLADQLYAAQAFTLRTKIMEGFLFGMLEMRNPSAGLSDAVLKEVARQGGNVQVYRLCEKFHLSQKHLDRIFQRQVGVSVKQVARCVRFGQILNKLNASPEPNLPLLAANAGFYDVSHLIKEFNLFTNNNPVAFLREDTRLAVTFTGQ